jgi:hypothetical protein
VARANAPVITVVIGSAKCRWPVARLELGEAATRTGPYNVDTAGGLWS